MRLLKIEVKKMVKGKHGDLLLDDEDTWFMEALYQQAANAAIRLTTMAENVLFKNKPRKVSIEFVVKVIEAMMTDKLKNLNTEIVKIGKRYYVEITGDKAFSQQPLIPFKGFYKWLKKNSIHTNSDPTDITPGDLFAVANERKVIKKPLKRE
jgi:hypothetical protein